jgi:RimJ/RimL family protein N-acetyltransferase
MDTQLFEGELVRLAPPDPERDAEIESKWTHDVDYQRLLDLGPIRPLSPGQIKKKYEEAEKDGNAHRRFHFALRAKTDDRLIGFIKIDEIEWMHGTGWLRLGIGLPGDRGRGYGAEALKLMLRYAFAELNLHRLTADVAQDNERALRFFQRAGFSVEVRLRQAIRRDGHYCDAIKLGILREEWQA